MQLHILLTADHAYIDPGTGKLYVLGAFNNIGLSEFPGRHGKMTLVVRIIAAFGDHTQEHMLTAVLMDEDGTEILKLSTPFILPIKSDGSRPHFNMIAELGGVLFPRPGRYLFRIYVEGEELGSTPIDIAQLER